MSEDDIVKRAREGLCEPNVFCPDCDMLREACDEIERLRAANLENLDRLTKRTHELSRAMDERNRLRVALRNAVAACVPGTLTRLEVERIAKEALDE